MTREYRPRRHAGMGAGTLNVNRNKRSVVLDLTVAADLDAFWALLATADVFVTNLRPHALAKFGLTPEAIGERFPSLVHVNAQGYRAGTPQADDAAYDDVIQAVTGLVDMNRRVTGEASYLPTIIADKVAGLYIVQGVLAALLERGRSGRGQHVEVPMVDAMLAFTLVDHLEAATFVPPAGPAGFPRSLQPGAPGGADRATAGRASSPTPRATSATSSRAVGPRRNSPTDVRFSDAPPPSPSTTRTCTR